MKNLVISAGARCIRFKVEGNPFSDIKEPRAINKKGMATYINAPLKRFILSCGFRNKRKMTKGMKKTYKIKPSILHRIEIKHVRELNRKCINFFECMARLAKYMLHARKKRNKGSRMTSTDKWFDKGKSAKAKQAHRAALRWKIASVRR